MTQPQPATNAPEKPHLLGRMGRFLRRNIWEIVFAALLSAWLDN